MMWFFSIFWITIEKTSPSLFSNSFKIISFSAALSICKITCFAVWAAILPAVFVSSSICIVVPISASVLIFFASDRLISNSGSSGVSTTFFTICADISPVPGSRFTEIF